MPTRSPPALCMASGPRRRFLPMRVLLFLLLAAASAAFAADPRIVTVPDQAAPPATAPAPAPGPPQSVIPGPEGPPAPQPEVSKSGTEQSPLFVRVLPEPKTAQEAEDERRELEKRAATEQDLAKYTLYLAIATALLFVAATAQAGLFVWQLILLRRSVQDSAMAASASTRSANTSEESFRRLERPYIFAFGVNRLRVNVQVAGGRPFVTYDIANHGKTPAIVENMRASFSTGEVDPETPLRVDEDHSLLISPIMGAGEIRKKLVGQLPDGVATTSQWAGNNDYYDIEVPNIPNAEDLFFWIRVEYRGAFSRGHESSFCWRFHKGDRLFVQHGGDEYNYVR